MQVKIKDKEVENKLEEYVVVNPKLCVGLFLLGALSHYDKEEVVKHAGIQYIAKVLKKKHYGVKHGSIHEKTWSDEMYVRKQIAPHVKSNNKKKVIEIQEKYAKAVTQAVRTHNCWIAHSQIANSAWGKASDRFAHNNSITVNQLILALLRKSPDAAKWYGFNQKKLDKFEQMDTEHKGQFIFSSSKVATQLLAELESEIAYFNHNQLQKEVA